MRRHIIALACAVVGMTAGGAASAAQGVEMDPLTHTPLIQNPNAVGVAGRPLAVAIPRETVNFSGNYAPGTVVISTSERRLYYVLPGGQAVKYGVGVGRPGFEWSGTKLSLIHI